MTRTRRVIALVGSLLAAGAAWTAGPALAAPPSCAAALFVPTDGGTHIVEQPDSAAGAIFCETELPLTFAVADAPTHGMLTALTPNGTGGATFSYLPNLGYAGNDAFTLEASDGDNPAVRVTVSVQVRAPINDAPECNAALYAQTEGVTYRVEASEPAQGRIECFDDEGTALTFAVAEAPAHGTLGAITPDGTDAADFTYTPGPAAGTDSFALIASDGELASARAEIDVTIVQADNDPPTCTADLATTVDTSGAFEIEQGTAVSALILCDDDEGDALSFTVSTAPAHGALAPLVTRGDEGVETAYTPAPGYQGFDLFRVAVSDGANPATVVTVRVRLVPARNDPPRCTVDVNAPVDSGRYRLEQDRRISGRLDCVDENETLGYAATTGPQHGVLSPISTDGSFTFTASRSYTGPDSFTLVANDGAQQSAPVDVPVEITVAVDDPPVCELAMSAGIDPDGAYLVAVSRITRGRVVCTDDEGQDLAFSLVAAPVHGAITALTKDTDATASFSYTPVAGYLGADSFTLAADDAVTGPQPIVVAIKVVDPGPGAPRCSGRLHTVGTDGGFEVESGESVHGTLTCFDPDGDELTFSVIRPPVAGAVSGLQSTPGSAQFTYTAGNTTGSDRLEMVASDGSQSSNVVRFDIRLVTPYDSPPECSAGLFATPLHDMTYPAENARPNAGIVSCVDDEGGPLTFDVIGAPQQGEIAGLNPQGEFATFDYVARTGYLGPDSAQLRVRDGAGGEDVVTFSVAVRTSSNTPPSCTATMQASLTQGAYDIAAGQAVDGQLSCQDAESDAVAITVSQAPARGTLSALAGAGTSRSFTFTAPRGPGGSDSFVLRAIDALGATRDATVAVRIAPQPPPTQEPEAGSPGTVAPVPGGTGTGTPPAGQPAPGGPLPDGRGPAASPPVKLSVPSTVRLAALLKGVTVKASGLKARSKVVVRLRLRSRTLATFKDKANAAGSAKVTIRLSKPLYARLKKTRKTSRQKLQIALRFTLTGSDGTERTLVRIVKVR